MNTNILSLKEVFSICLSGKLQPFIAKLQPPGILASQNKVLQGQGSRDRLPNYWVTNIPFKNIK